MLVELLGRKRPSQFLQGAQPLNNSKGYQVRTGRVIRVLNLFITLKGYQVRTGGVSPLLQGG